MSDFWLSTLICAQADEANVFSYFGNSNLAGKIVVILLILFSVVAWTVMLGKYMDLKRLRLLNFNIERKLSKLDRVFEMSPGGASACPYAKILAAALDANQRFAQKDSQKSVRIGHVENAIQRMVSQVCLKYESRMVILGSIVTAAPFMGLLGTVWGVMDAFGSMGMQSSATIQALAPGVSGALLTTVAGLIVAIPSVMGYNYLLATTKVMITELENFASSLADRVELEMD